MLFDLVFRWIHILSAITLVGGVFFMRFALLPGLKHLEDSQRRDICSSIRPFWARCVMITSALLILSGLINAVKTMTAFEFDGPYHGLVGAKILLALGVFLISAVLSGRSSTADRFREKKSFWLNVNVALAVAIVCLASYMRSIDRTKKMEGESRVSAVSSPDISPRC